eukprot:CAMPEP_0181284690 /NCGR_PEP_ID=MMETSP1097-20121128/15548_1 /TAXON_ID=35684 /ORGANISM="Pseudopedinella elastica, Strain CCMP716" /LENGTH=50 /DNA_ID=CAMNT_0023388161 /DNA_START=13 /DNA_END=161 /DNA_ORIENTATION=-
MTLSSSVFSWVTRSSDSFMALTLRSSSARARSFSFSNLTSFRLRASRFET